MREKGFWGEEREREGVGGDDCKNNLDSSFFSFLF